MLCRLPYIFNFILKTNTWPTLAVLQNQRPFDKVLLRGINFQLINGFQRYWNPNEGQTFKSTECFLTFPSVLGNIDLFRTFLLSILSKINCTKANNQSRHRINCRKHLCSI